MSCASCTTNCSGARSSKVLNDTFGIVKGHMVTVHSYTNDQRLLDLPHSDMRRATRGRTVDDPDVDRRGHRRSASCLPELKGKLDGTAIRVPTPNVSLTCLTAHVGRNTDRDEVNGALEGSGRGPASSGILQFEETPAGLDRLHGESPFVDSAMPRRRRSSAAT